MVTPAANPNLLDLNIFILTAPSRFRLEPYVTTRTMSNYRKWREKTFVTAVTRGLTLGQPKFQNGKECHFAPVVRTLRVTRMGGHNVAHDLG